MNIDFSVIIPTFNGVNMILDLLRRIDNFSTGYAIEIIVIDSQSTDGTVAAVKKIKLKHCSLRIIPVLKNDFNHGKTRNLGAKSVKGKFVLFISQDALPTTSNLFKYFYQDFNNNQKIKAVFAKQIPYKTSPLIQQIESVRDFNILDSYCKRSILIFDRNHPFIPYSTENYFIWYFLSNVCACYRRSYLLKFPFPEIDHGEDIIAGKDIIEKKLLKIYDKRIKVNHSHSYNFYEYYLREKKDIYFYTEVLRLKKQSRLSQKIVDVFQFRLSYIDKLLYLIKLPVYYIIKIYIVLEIRLGVYKFSVYLF